MEVEIMSDFDSLGDKTGFGKPIDDEALWRAVCEVAGERGGDPGLLRTASKRYGPAFPVERMGASALLTEVAETAEQRVPAGVDAAAAAVMAAIAELQAMQRLEVLAEAYPMPPPPSIDFQPPPELLGRKWHILRWDDGDIEVAKWHRATRTWMFAGEEQEYQCTDEMFECLTWVGVVEAPERGTPITMEDMKAAWGRVFQR